MNNIGVIIIGRNEGERLVACLKSVLRETRGSADIVYVDSGSTDNSIESANALGVDVVNLDMSVPFTMARGRNTGFRYLVQHHPDLEFVQFIDGDCELVDGWLDKALLHLKEDSSLAIVCGRRREKIPEQSPYNLLADMEWNTPIGDAKACGGDSLARVSAIENVGGFNEALICGEEPEMCIRLRAKGWKIHRLDADMTRHDAAMTRFSQWWKRSIRGGWAIAEGRTMYGHSPEAYMVKQSLSGWLWGAIIPSAIITLVWPTRGLSLLLLVGYIYQAWRIYQYRQQSFGDTPHNARTYAIYCILSKFPQIIGQIKYSLSRLSDKPATLIEYKSVPKHG
jgi:glycosyltransferase involved in cell wall biosynthesis